AVLFFLCRHAPRPISARFPYTTLFRSQGGRTVEAGGGLGRHSQGRGRKIGRCVRHRRVSAGCAGSVSRRRRGAGRFEGRDSAGRSEEHTSELQSRENLVCRLLLEKKKK